VTDDPATTAGPVGKAPTIATWDMEMGRGARARFWRKLVGGSSSATLIAWPLGYWEMSRWLEGFAFRSRLGADIFLMSGLAALGIAALTVSSQVLKAARANPAESLKYE